MITIHGSIPSKKTIQEFIENYPNRGKKWCMENLKMRDGQIRYYAEKFDLKSNFKHNPEADYERGKGFRGKKRPKHSLLLRERGECPANHFTPEIRKKIGRSLSIEIKEGRIRVDRFRGHHHTLSSKMKMSEKLTGRMSVSAMRNGKFGNVKRGWYDINGKRMFFRSKWEVNYALYLDFLVKQKQIREWLYEKDVFIFDKIKFGTRSFRPDFKIINNDSSVEYHEIKGWMDRRSETKLKRMRKYYPKIKVVLVDQVYYKNLVKKVGRVIGFL
jgi:hypothetical protein